MMFVVHVFGVTSIEVKQHRIENVEEPRNYSWWIMLLKWVLKDSTKRKISFSNPYVVLSWNYTDLIQGSLNQSLEKWEEFMQ